MQSGDVAFSSAKCHVMSCQILKTKPTHSFFKISVERLSFNSSTSLILALEPAKTPDCPLL